MPPSKRVISPCTSRANTITDATEIGTSRRSVAESTGIVRTTAAAEHERDIGDVRADDVADTDVEIALASGDTGHHHLWGRRTEPDEHRTDDHRRDVVEHCETGSARHEVISSEGEDDQPSDGEDETEDHGCGLLSPDRGEQQAPPG